eukprot:gnl/Chilomastix_caulleri/1295.p1 GENE.gnl/Chilomastix_caulleri/1295~~gnl/Chilomastix_caulleri/1295.p1  ORF type:complete len:127 (+),score=22.26 gnl/Chilomastix_caulleri/1295:39-383(+)
MDDQFTGTVIWIGNLSRDITDDDLKNHFSSYGNLVSIRRSEEGRGPFAFATFETPVARKYLIDAMSGRPVMPHNHPIRVSLPAEEVRAAGGKGLSYSQSRPNRRATGEEDEKNH